MHTFSVLTLKIKYFILYVFLFFLVFYTNNLATANTINNAQTGYSGLLRVPSAQVTPYGQVAFSHTWEDGVQRSLPYAQGAHNTALLNIGIIPNLEFSVQNAYKSINGSKPGYNQGGSSDLAFSAKYNFSYLLAIMGLSDIGAQLAVGVQDFSLRDNANYHANKYAVATLPIDDFEFTLGYGQGDTNNQMGAKFLDGAFAGIEYNIHPNLSLLADYDGTGINAGIYAHYAPEFFPEGWQANLKLQLYSGSDTKDRDNRFAALGLNIPMGYPKSKQPKIIIPKHEVTQSQINTNLTAAQSVNNNHNYIENISPSTSAIDDRTNNRFTGSVDATNSFDEKIIKALSKQGFENIKVTAQGAGIVVFLENHYFRKGQTRGLAEAIRTITQHTNKPVNLVLMYNNMPILTTHINTEELKHPKNQASFNSSIAFSYPNRQIKALASQSGKTQASGQFKPRLELSPYLLSTLGTEWGVFDYALGLASNLRIQTWKGGMLDVRHIADLDQSDDAGFVGHPIQPINSGVDRALLHQTWIPTSNISTQFSAGIIKTDLVGVGNETQWRSDTGQHKAFASLAKYEHKDSKVEYDIQKLGYRYFLPNYKHAIVASAGRVNDIKSLNFELQNWYGDVRTDVVIEKFIDGETYAGLKFKLPFDLDHGTHPSHGFQVSGSPEWVWGYDTQISNKQNIVANRLSANIFDLQYNLDLQYDRDRLSPGYLETQLPYIYGIVLMPNTAGF